MHKFALLFREVCKRGEVPTRHFLHAIRCGSMFPQKTSQRPDVPTPVFYIQFVVGTFSHNSGQGSHTPVFTGRASWEHAPRTQGQWECEGESRHVLPSPHAGPPRGFEKKVRGQIIVRDPSHAPRRKSDLKPDIWQRSGFLATPATLWALPFSLPFSRGKGKCPPKGGVGASSRRKAGF